MQEQQDQEPKETKRKRIKGDYSIRYFSSYAYNRIRKLYPEYTQTDIHRAIMMYYELAQEDLSVGDKIHLSNKLGSLYLTKEERGIVYNPETGTLTNKLPINILETRKLWKQKPELTNKVFVRFTNEHSNNFLFKLRYELNRAMYKNKRVYNFVFNRTLKKKLVENIKQKKVDAYLIPQKYEYKNEQ